MLIFACNKRNHQNKNDMKHTITTLFLLLLLAVAGMAKAQSFQPYKSGVIQYHGYAYPIVPGTETWKQIDYPQRVASLQLPVDTLRNISTARLLETCLYYPFNIDIFAFDDQLGSFGRVKHQFNGYAELYQGSTLQGFLQSGKLANPSDLDYIFNKARTL